jgi:uncharacterized membrane protein
MSRISRFSQHIHLSWCRWSLLGLVLLQPIWFAWLAPVQSLPLGFVLALTLLPLLLVLPGVWRLRQRPLVIAGFILMFHFCLAVMELWDPAARLPAVVQILLISVYFTGLPAIRRPASSD